jgi:hypothetical protein
MLLQQVFFQRDGPYYGLSVSNLDLDKQRFIESGKPMSLFPKFVFAAIFKRSVYHQPIKNFRLVCEETFVDGTMKYDFEMWLTSLAEHKLEHLEIQLDLGYYFPSCIFSLRNLVVLKLKYLNMFTFSDVDFPFLKSLHLNDVHYDVHFDERWFIFKFLTGCPILEDVEVENMTIGNMSDCPDRVHKRLPKLVRANISNTPIIHLPLEPFCIVESLRLVEVTFVLNLALGSSPPLCSLLNIIIFVIILTFMYVLSSSYL